MKGKTLLLTLALSAVVFSGCNMKSNDAAIKVNDEIITKGQYEKLFEEQSKNSMLAAMGIKMDKEKNGFMYLLTQQRVVNDLIVDALLNQELKKRGIEISKDDINQEIQSLMEQVGGKQQLSKILKEHNVNQKQFREDVYKSVRSKKLIEQLGVKPTTDAEAKKFYNENPAKFNIPEKVRASHILIAANPIEIAEGIRKNAKYKDAPETQISALVNEELAKKEGHALEILGELKKDKTQFAKIAKEQSEDEASAKNGGDLGFFAAGEMVPEFSKEAFSLKPDSISEKPVKSQFGYHIILVTDRTEAGKVPFEKAMPRIKAYLDNQKSADALDDLVESLKKQATIEYIDTELSPEEIQKGIQKEIDEAPAKLQKAEEAAAKNQAKE
jgi:parvulin-like peptidyl-prolyl isomerase